MESYINRPLILKTEVENIQANPKRHFNTMGMRVLPAIIFSSLLGCSVFSSNAMASGFTKALETGKPTVDIRVRGEVVDQDSVAKKANSLTARTRLGYKSGDFMGFKGFFEFENITALIDDYNIPKGSKTTYPVVADPEGSEVNQAFLTYGGMKNTLFKIGRQRVILDNARFIGNVGWRQNEQTFDAVLFNTTVIKNMSASYAFVDQVNGILGTSAKTNTHLVNVSFKGLPKTKITSYAYLIDMEKGTDNKTIGVSAKGKVPIKPSINVVYAFEYAQMSNYADNTSGTTAHYNLVELGTSFKTTTLKLGYEVLGSDGTTSFSTPLATKHAFNGWADKFLATPKDGLVDIYLTAITKVKGVKLLATYHKYASDNGDADYGSELNLLAVKKIGKRYSLGIKYAKYMEADSTIATNTSKAWLWTGIKF